MSVLMALLLGILQGTAEFLPVSGAGHMSLFQNLLGLSYDRTGHEFFDMLMSLSTLLSIVLVYKTELTDIVRDCADFLRGKIGDNPMDEGRLPPSVRLVLLILVGTVPMLLTLPVHSKIEPLFYKTAFVGFALLVTGTLLFASEKLIKPGRKTGKTMTSKDAFFIGLAQAFALIPGISRTGATIPTGMTRGLGQDYAVRFSLFLSIPVLLAQTISSLLAAMKGGIEWSLLLVYLIGFIVSVILGYFAIQFLRIAAAKKRMHYFAYYCWAIGVLTLILTLTH
jgi:undecaprenyl-diphosphatase